MESPMRWSSKVVIGRRVRRSNNRVRRVLASRWVRRTLTRHSAMPDSPPPSLPHPADLVFGLGRRVGTLRTALRGFRLRASRRQAA